MNMWRRPTIINRRKIQWTMKDNEILLLLMNEWDNRYWILMAIILKILMN